MQVFKAWFMQWCVQNILPKLLDWAQQTIPILASNALQDIIDKIKSRKGNKMNKVTIYVKDQDGKTVPDAPIQYKINDHESISNTDVNGICEIDNLPDGTHSFTTAPIGYDNPSEKITLGENSKASIILTVRKKASAPEQISEPNPISSIPIHNFGCKPDDADDRDYIFKSKKFSAQALPQSVDLRAYMSPIVDQGDLSDCTSAASVNGLREFQLNKEQAPYVQLSRLYHYYKERDLEGDTDKDEGAQLRNALKVLNKNGSCKYTTWPDSKGYQLAPDASADAEAANYLIKEYHRVNNIDDLKCALAENLPVVIGIKVYQSFEGKQASSTGIIPMPDTDNELCYGGHAVLVVGYDDSKNQLIVRNSWGASWGDKGYFYLPYDYMKYVSDMWTSTDSNTVVPANNDNNKGDIKMVNGQVAFNVKVGIGKATGPASMATVSFTVPGIPGTHESKVDAEGNFSVSGLPAVPITFVITAPGFPTREITVTPDNEKLASSDIVLAATTETLTALITAELADSSDSLVSTIMSAIATKLAAEASASSNIWIKILRGAEASIASTVATFSFPNIGSTLATAIIKILKAVGLDPDDTTITTDSIKK